MADCSHEDTHRFPPPGKLLPGMVVARPANGAQGSALLATGSVLDQKTLDSLHRHGIEFLTVDIPDSRDPQTISREIKEAEARVDYIFRGQGTLARARLHDTLIDYRREQAE